MIEDYFYATIKLKCGDEIFAKVAASDEGDKVYVVITNPTVLEEIKVRGRIVGYKLEPWLKTSTEDMLIVNMQDVLTMSESSDVEMIMTHQSYVRQTDGSRENEYKLNRKMGYLGNVNDTKEILEKIFKSS